MTDSEREKLMWRGLAWEIAHRMGTPLSALFGWLELLPGSKDPERVIEEMSGNLMQLTAISDRLGQIGQPTKFGVVSAAEIFDAVVEYVRPRLPSGDPGIQFNQEISGDPRFEVNRLLLEWTIEHLIRNSVDAVDRNSGKIDLCAYQREDDVILEITDNGCGINEEIRETMFDPGITTLRKGRGIGLALAKHIVEQVHQGELILLESGQQSGTTFRIVLSAERKR
jgi:signal transduction histidine kinase